MDQEQKNKIFDRLYSLQLDIDSQSIINPGYINDKIAECHKYIEEVEKFYIDVSKEISIFQQSLNNAVADFEIKKDNLLINNEEIKNLPNIRDREAHANSHLRKETNTIRNYENQITSLENIFKIINLKNKNLNRVNADLKIMVRTLEVQAKFNDYGNADIATKSLVEEFKKSMFNEDSFEDVKTEIIKEETLDTTVPLDVNNLLTNPEITENLITPVPLETNNLLTEIKTEPILEDSEINNLLTETKIEPITENLITPIPLSTTILDLDDLLKQFETSEQPVISSEKIKEVLFSEDGSLIPEEPGKSTKTFLDSLQNSEEEIPVDSWTDQITVSNVTDTNTTDLSTIDLDKIIEFTPQKEGGKTQKLQGDTAQKDPKIQIGIDLDDLLESLPKLKGVS